MKPAVFLDRDGVLNKVVFRDGKLSTPFDPEEMEFLPGVKEAMARLKQIGYWCLVITNQPNAGKDFSFETLRIMNEILHDELGVDEVYCCSHGDESGCDWYKPRPGMIVRAVMDFDIDLSHSWVIGDRWRDIELAENVGLSSILINSEATKYDNRVLSPTVQADSLLAVAGWIVSPQM